MAVPVSEVDRAKAFYTDGVGFQADHDQEVGDRRARLGSFVYFDDPDRNEWAVQQLPGRR